MLVTHSLTHSLTHWCVAAVGRSAMVAAALAAGMQAQHLAHSTHDWQRFATTGIGATAAWSDVKTPGNERTYAVGTTWVDHTDHLTQYVQFSGVGGTGPSSPTQGPNILANGQNAIVAILQVTDSSGSIQWQRFFHGDGGALLATTVNTTVGRSVSVFPAATPQATRVAICGETFDARLPLNPTESGSSGASWTASSGYIAVYDGNGVLLWTHLVFGNDTFASTIVTDLSIRVDSSGCDIVTYCGVSTNGRYEVGPPGPDPLPLDPLKPFPVVPSVPPCPGDGYALGDAANHPLDPTTLAPDRSAPSGNADGFVGRLAYDYTPPLGTVPLERVFHSIVGGYGHDGLWGLVEKDPDHFAVVGTTTSFGAPLIGPTVYPLTRPRWTGPATICLSTAAAGAGYMHGVLTEFDTSLITPTGGVLLLNASTLIGAPGYKTMARDVLWQGGEYFVVGSSDDPNFDGVPSPCGQAVGYVVATPDPNGVPPSPGAPGEFTHVRALAAPTAECHASGAVGVAGWNEHPDHIGVFGWHQKTPSGEKNLVVHSLFRDTTTGSPTPSLNVLRTYVVESLGDEFAGSVDGQGGWVFPTAPAAVPFTFGYGTVPIGHAGGGGLGVDSRGRFTIAGSTSDAVGYPVTLSKPNSRPASAALPPTAPPPVFNGVLSRIDMLPIGACRSDGTGTCPGVSWTPVGPGGTTPACALSPFGNVLGATSPPALQRMLLDYDGVLVAGQPVSLVVDRPPPASWVVASVWQVGFPVNTPLFLPAHDVDLWIMTGGPPPYIGALLPNGASLRESFGGSVLPPGATYMVQYVCYLAQPLTGTPCPGPDLTIAATPALVFNL